MVWSELGVYCAYLLNATAKAVVADKRVRVQNSESEVRSIPTSQMLSAQFSQIARTLPFRPEFRTFAPLFLLTAPSALTRLLIAVSVGVLLVRV